MNPLNEGYEQVFLEQAGKVYVKHTRELVEKLSNGPVTVDFFESFIDDVCSHYSQGGDDYKTAVNKLGEKLDEYLGADRERVVNWLETENPSLGMAKPIELVLIGRAEGVVNFVEKLIQDEKNKDKA